ncbi:putative protein S-layer protein precursor [Pyrococcus sp. NA2]|uniref:S-layer protein n=1 Tax=Pyrococcus sp. (strain NA2) TaxID=342949 RepID=UPI000209AE3D|nr:S-layer protein [Pyrococcus sp. NA2]AEC52889.1 putative protein S-layer protein precursor [Pyrococcus sp. NA2]
MKVKKIAALAVGAAVAGATLGLASAQPEVPQIPKDFFVKDGKPNVKIVVGSQGAAMDVVSAADIAAAIGSLLYTEEDVEVSDVSVVVKKDISYDPPDIPVFEAIKKGAIAGDYEDLKNVNGWWNGSFYIYSDGEKIYIKPYFTASLGTSAWDGSPPTLEIAEVNDTVFLPYYEAGSYENIDWSAGSATLKFTAWQDTYNPLSFWAKDNLYWKLEEPVYYTKPDGTKISFQEGTTLDYHVKINKIEFDPDQWKEIQKEYGDVPPQHISLVIPKNGVNATIEFKLNVYDYSYRAKSGVVHHIYFFDDRFYSPYFVKQVRDGAKVGDIIQLPGLDKKYQIVDIGTPNFLGDHQTYDIVLGNYMGDYYVDKDESITVGNYTITVLDLDVAGKAMLKVSGPEGSEIITLDSTISTKKAKVLFDGGIRVELEDTFIGVGGTLSAHIKVWTDLIGIKGSTLDLYPGWKVTFVTVDTDGNGKPDTLTKVYITNNQDLKGDTIVLFNTFKVYYDAKVYQERDSYGTLHTGMEAWIRIDPVKHQYEEITLGVGDTIEESEYSIGDVEVKFSPETAYIPKKVTEPITVLDTEIMEQGLENVDSNLILVGGPVVNQVTAALAEDLGVPATYEEWKEKFGTGAESGQIIYKEKCSKIGGYGVLLVAGTDREGTRAAAEALLEYISKL